MDTTDTTGQHHDAHHIQSNLSVSSAVVNTFTSMSKRAEESFAASASETQKPVHCAAMMRMPTWTVTQYFLEYRELEATPSVKTCVSKIPSSSGQLEAAGASGSGRPVAAEDPSNTSEGKVHLQSNSDSGATSRATAYRLLLG